MKEQQRLLKEKFQEFETKLSNNKEEIENSLLTKLYYFKKFRWRILKNRGGSELTQFCNLTLVNNFQYGGKKQITACSSSCIPNFMPIQADLKKVKITWTDNLDSIAYYNNNQIMKSNNPTPTLNFEFSEPTQLKIVNFFAVNTAPPGNTGNMDYNSLPEAWIFEGTNDGYDWIILSEEKNYSSWNKENYFFEICLKTSSK